VSTKAGSTPESTSIAWAYFGRTRKSHVVPNEDPAFASFPGNPIFLSSLLWATVREALSHCAISKIRAV
jgi:hypothetical protein